MADVPLNEGQFSKRLQKLRGNGENASMAGEVANADPRSCSGEGAPGSRPISKDSARPTSKDSARPCSRGSQCSRESRRGSGSQEAGADSFKLPSRLGTGKSSKGGSRLNTATITNQFPGPPQATGRPDSRGATSDGTEQPSVPCSAESSRKNRRSKAVGFERPSDSRGGESTASNVSRKAEAKARRKSLDKSLARAQGEGATKERISQSRLTLLHPELAGHFRRTHIPEVQLHHRPISAEGERNPLADPDSSEDSTGDDEPTGGILLDIIKRKAHGGSVKKLLHNLSQGDPGTYEYTRGAILRDEFLALVWEDVTAFYKNPAAVKEAGGSAKAWEKVTTAHIIGKVREICAIKREVVCFNAEVYNWLISFKLLNIAPPWKGENVRERTNRKEEFWLQHQESLNRRELPPIQASHGLSSSMKGSSSAPTLRPLSPSRSKSASPKKSMCFDGDDQWGMIGKIEARSKKQRERPRSSERHVHPRHGMKWHSDTGKMKWQCVDPPEGTRASLIQHTHLGSTSGSGICGHIVKKRLTLGGAKKPGMVLPSLLHRSQTGQLPELTDHATNSYLEACQRCWIVPTPLPFVTGHSWKLQAAGRDMTDSDLRAVAAMIQEVAVIEEVDLSGNLLLTEKTLVPFLSRLFGDPAASTLQSLILKEVKNIGVSSVQVIERLLSEGNGARNLRRLDLSHVHIHPKSHLGLAKAVHGHSCIQDINISDTAIGSNSWIAKQCMTLIMKAKLKKLDVGWNCFDADVFQHLGECVVGMKLLHTLCVSNCSCASIHKDVPPPITFFLECLSRDESLTFLDVSLNRMDFRAMLIIADALSMHDEIHKLDISSNPLGVLGIRCALRLLNKTTNTLVYFESEGCYGSAEVGAKTFNMTNPQGRYSLDLTRPYHRTQMRLLLQMCEYYKVPADLAFVAVKWTAGAWNHPSKSPYGYSRKMLYDVPAVGTVHFVFNMDAGIEGAIKGIDDDDFEGFIDAHRVLTKIKPSFKKVIPMFACFKQLQGKDVAQLAFLDAMAKDFYLDPSHVEHMCRSCPPMKSAIISRLLPSVSGGEMGECLCLLLYPSIQEFVRHHKVMRNFLDFNIENPTGHYKLDLGRSTDYAVAEKLLLLDRWEVGVGRRQGRRDTSQRGNGSHVRNEQYRGMSLHAHVESIAEWTLPENNVFEFDYTSGKRCGADTASLNQQTFVNILVSMFDALCGNAAKLEVLRLLSHHICMTSLQMRELLGCFKEESDRAEAFVTFYLRVKDMWNSKVFRVRFASQEELVMLQERLGLAIFFPFIQPENAYFELDFAVYDHRMCANILIQLANKEGLSNIRKPVYILPGGIIDPLPVGVPKSWEAFDKMPKEGVFKCDYLTAPENRRYELRKGLAEDYASFPMLVQEQDVMWWTGLTEVSEDVLDWLEFCIGNFKNMDAAFTKIDGPGGNGVVSLREFEEGVDECGCKKFDGKDKAKRIDSLFRYLDPGGEGSVSREEWSILSQLWKEFELCIKEFVLFLVRTFGDDLEVAWEALDDDGSGELDEEEWMRNVENLGYFGPAKCVFALVDNSDDGNISWEEFQVLERYKNKKS